MSRAAKNKRDDVMKFRTLLSALLIAASLVCVTGCGKKAGCPCDNSGAKAASPTEAAKKFFEASKSVDFAAMAQLCDGELKAFYERTAANLKELEDKAAKGDELAKRKVEEAKKAVETAKAALKDRKIEFANEKIGGAFATVDVVGEKGGKKIKDDTVCVKKVGADWKVISRKEYEAAVKPVVKK